MKLLTALTSEIEIAYQDSMLPFMEANFRSENFSSLLHEKNTFVVLVCIEQNDNVRDVKESAIRISNQFLNVRESASTICLIPFAHLTDQALDDIDQVDLLIDKLGRVLTNKGHKVRWIPPAKGNLFMTKWMFFDRYFSVKLGTTETSLKSSLKSLIRAHGVQKIMSTLGDLLKVK